MFVDVMKEDKFATFFATNFHSVTFSLSALLSCMKVFLVIVRELYLFNWHEGHSSVTVILLYVPAFILPEVLSYQWSIYIFIVQNIHIYIHTYRGH